MQASLRIQSQPQRAVVRPSRTATRVCAQLPGRDNLLDVRTVAASFATAALLFCGTANAGVILEQPETKKLFQASGTEKVSSEPGAPKPKAAPKPKKESSGESSGGIDIRGFILPLSVAGIAGAGFALSKIDPEFATVLDKGSLKDSNIDGAGYEAGLKAGGDWPKYELAISNGRGGAKRGGTTKVGGTGLFKKK